MSVGKYISLFFKAVINPVTITTFFAPTLMNINLIAMRENLSRASGDWQQKLYITLNDTTTLAVIDYRTQFYTLLLVLIFYIAQNTSFYWRHFFKSHTGQVAIDILTHDRQAMIHAFIAFATCVVVLYFSVTGLLGNDEIVANYIRETPGIDIASPPPLDSYITWLRGLLIFMGIYTSLVIRSYESRHEARQE